MMVMIQVDMDVCIRMVMVYLILKSLFVMQQDHLFFLVADRGPLSQFSIVVSESLARGRKERPNFAPT